MYVFVKNEDKEPVRYNHRAGQSHTTYLRSSNSPEFKELWREMIFDITW